MIAVVQILISATLVFASESKSTPLEKCAFEASNEHIKILSQYVGLYSVSQLDNIFREVRSKCVANGDAAVGLTPAQRVDAMAKGVTRSIAQHFPEFLAKLRNGKPF